VRACVRACSVRLRAWGPLGQLCPHHSCSAVCPRLPPPPLPPHRLRLDLAAAAGRVVEAAPKHPDKGVEAELVKGVDLGEAVEKEEQHRAALRHGAVPEGEGSSWLVVRLAFAEGSKPKQRERWAQQALQVLAKHPPSSRKKSSSAAPATHLLRLSLMAPSVSRASATLSVMSLATRLDSSNDSMRATSSGGRASGEGFGWAEL
jgi:hypothetical protein